MRKNIPANEHNKMILNALGIKDDFLNELKVKHTKPLKDNGYKKQITEFDKRWSMNDKIIELFSNNIKQDQDLRNKYAVILMRTLIIYLIVLVVIFILNGAGVLKYSEKSFNIFISGGILEIFVLVRVIVKYLFKDNLTDALKIIIENTNKKYINRKKINKKSDKR